MSTTSPPRRTSRPTDASGRRQATGRPETTGRTGATGRTGTARGTGTTGRTATATRGTRPRPAPSRPTSRPTSRPRPDAARRRPRRPRRPLRLANPSRRATALLIVSLMVFTVFAGRLLELQAVRGEALATAAVDQRLRTVVVPADRGRITDANGVVLAETVDAVNVTVDQTMVKDVEGEAAELAPLVGMSTSDVAKKLDGTRRFAYVAKQVTPDAWHQISNLKLPGIFSERTSLRTYPAGDLAANVVGFVGADGHGLGGYELGLDKVLKGTDGKQVYEAAGANTIPTAQQSSVDPVPGTDVRLTIDRDIQFVAQQTLAAQVKRAKADYGTAVVMDPKGRILALAEAPTFDPNKPASSPAADRGNRSLSDVYEPGSTAKVVTLSAVIDQKKATPLTPVTVPPVLHRGGTTFHDSEAHGTEHLTLAGVMAKSSNMGTILAAERIGGDTLYQYMKRYGLGEKAGVGFPGESSGRVPAPDNWSNTTFPTLAFGQGYSVNAVQAASVYATIANDGVRVQPRLLEGYVKPDGTLQTPPPAKQTVVVRPDTARTVRVMLEQVVSQGTAPLAAIPGYRVEGKTGTAQLVDPTCKCYRGVVASFIGMAPADKPALVVAVSIVNPRSGRYGGQLAAPVFQQVMTYALQARRIPPTGTTAPELPISLDGSR